MPQISLRSIESGDSFYVSGPDNADTSLLLSEALRRSAAAEAYNTTPHTCPHCQEITVRTPPHDDRWMGRMIRGGQGGYTFATIRASRVVQHSSSCKFFEWALEGFRKECGNTLVDDNWELAGTIPYRYLRRGSSDVPYIVFAWYHKSDGRLDRQFRIDMLSILAEESDPASAMIPRRPGTRGAFSDLPPEVLRDFVPDCQERHKSCNIAVDSQMPSYLIEILAYPTAASSPALRLVHRPEPQKYAALSYCWGGDQTVKLTMATIAEFKTALPYSKLPRTIQDAITTSQVLNIGCLWVDVLCVVQDDPVHIAGEIALMPSIYQGAYITIYAARSRHADQGFLDDISVPSISSHAFRFRIETQDADVALDNDGNVTGEYFLPNIAGSVVCFSDSDESNVMNPIDRRGWTFQEYLLSPRILDFGTYQTSYKCLKFELRASDHHSLDYSIPAEEVNAFRSQFHDPHAGGGQDNGTSASKNWRTAMELFTRREITVPRDRLLAISGIALVQGRYERGDYLAGLWREHLNTQLLWEVAGSKRPRPAAYRAPSWSWAAVDGPVKFHGGSLPEKSEWDFQILDARIDLQDISLPYGEVENGSLAIRGWIKPKRVINEGRSLVDMDWKQPGDEDRLETGFELPWGKFPPVLICPDSKGELVNDTCVYCLEITRYEDGNWMKTGPYGLVLVLAEPGATTVFRRVAIFKFDPRVYPSLSFLDQLYKQYIEVQSTWMDGAERRDITII